MFYTFQWLYSEKNPMSDISRFDKVAKVLGKDVEGNLAETNSYYSPIYIRAVDRILTCTKHAESSHMHIN